MHTPRQVVRMTLGAAAIALLAACGGGGRIHAGLERGRPGTTTSSNSASTTTTPTGDSTTTVGPSPSTAKGPTAPGPATRAPGGPPRPVPAPAPSSSNAGAQRAFVAGCPLFPPDNPWERDVSADPVDPRSDAYVASIGAGLHLHPDFGSNPSYGIPFVVVPGSQPRVPITFTEYGDESDPGPYPVPPDAPVEAGDDRHALVVDNGHCQLFELYHAARNDHGGWDAGSGAVFDLRSDRLRPDGWTSADAAGLPILPGLVRYDEVAAGHIDHALRFTVARSQRGYIHPATHFASSSTDPNLPPMGLRLRLKSTYDVSGFHGEARVVLDALRRYGMLVADNGSSWYVTGSTDSRWNDDDLDQLKQVPATAFEVVQSGPILHG